MTSLGIFQLEDQGGKGCNISWDFKKRFLGLRRCVDEKAPVDRSATFLK